MFVSVGNTIEDRVSDLLFPGRAGCTLFVALWERGCPPMQPARTRIVFTYREPIPRHIWPGRYCTYIVDSVRQRCNVSFRRLDGSADTRESTVWSVVQRALDIPTST